MKWTNRVDEYWREKEWGGEGLNVLRGRVGTWKVEDTSACEEKGVRNIDVER